MSEKRDTLPPEWSKDGIRKEELPWTPAGFRYIDSNNDNMLSKQELINAYKKFDIQDRGKPWSDSFYDGVVDGNLSSANLDNDITTMSYGEAMFDAHGHEVNETNAGKSAEELERLRNNMNLNNFKAKYGEKEYMQLARYDDNVDGVLTKDEVRTGAKYTEQEVKDLLQQQKIMKNIKIIGFPESSTVSTVADSFDNLDPNKDGFLDADEIVKKQNITLEQAQSAIKNIDLDNNAKVSLGETAYAVNLNKDIDLTTLPDDTVKNRLNEYDLNKDGKITKDEIIAHDKELDERNKRSDKESGLSTGAIIGIVIASVFVIGLAVGLIIYFSRKKKTTQSAKKENSLNKKNNDEANCNTDSIKKDSKVHS